MYLRPFSLDAICLGVGTAWKKRMWIDWLVQSHFILWISRDGEPAEFWTGDLVAFEEQLNRMETDGVSPCVITWTQKIRKAGLVSTTETEQVWRQYVATCDTPACPCLSAYVCSLARWADSFQLSTNSRRTSERNRCHAAVLCAVNNCKWIQTGEWDYFRVRCGESKKAAYALREMVALLPISKHKSTKSKWSVENHLLVGEFISDMQSRAAQILNECC